MSSFSDKIAEEFVEPMKIWTALDMQDEFWITRLFLWPAEENKFGSRFILFDVLRVYVFVGEVPYSKSAYSN